MDAENERAETPLRVKQRSERRRLRSLKRKKTDKASTNSVRTVDVDRPHHDGSPVFVHTKHRRGRGKALITDANADVKTHSTEAVTATCAVAPSPQTHAGKDGGQGAFERDQVQDAEKENHQDSDTKFSAASQEFVASPQLRDSHHATLSKVGVVTAATDPSPTWEPGKLPENHPPDEGSPSSALDFSHDRGDLQPNTLSDQELPTTNPASLASVDRCPLCSEEYCKGASEEERAVHFDQCFAAQAKHHAAHPGEAAHMGPIVRLEGPSPSQDLYFCHVCNKELTGMSNGPRNLHVNKCLDKLEEQLRQPNGASDLSWSGAAGVKACPVCGKSLANTQLSSVKHLKQCAKENGVPTAELVELVRQTGSLPRGGSGHRFPLSTAGKRKASNVPASNQSSSSDFQPSPVGREPPKAQVTTNARAKGKGKRQGGRANQVAQDSDEEQLQLAQAMSLSETSLTAQKAARKKKRPTKAEQRLTAPVPALVLQTEEEARKGLERRLNAMIGPPAEGTGAQSPSPSKTFRSEWLPPCTTLWRLSSSVAEYDSCSYHVEGVFPSPRTFRLSLVSPAARAMERQRLEEEEEEEEEEEAVCKTALSTSPAAPRARGGAIPFAGGCSPSTPKSTSPAEEREASLGAESSPAPKSLPGNGFLGEVGDAIQPSVSFRGAQVDGLQCFSTFVANPAFADAEIHLDDGSTVPIHQLVFRARLPTNNLFRFCQRGGNQYHRFELKGSARDDLISVLTFVYTGQCHVPWEHRASVLRLSHQFGVDKLLSLLIDDGVEGLNGTEALSTCMSCGSDAPLFACGDVEAVGQGQEDLPAAPRRPGDGPVEDGEAVKRFPSPKSLSAPMSTSASASLPAVEIMSSDEDERLGFGLEKPVVIRGVHDLAPVAGSADGTTRPSGVLSDAGRPTPQRVTADSPLSNKALSSELPQRQPDTIGPARRDLNLLGNRSPEASLLRSSPSGSEMSDVEMFNGGQLEEAWQPSSPLGDVGDMVITGGVSEDEMTGDHPVSAWTKTGNSDPLALSSSELDEDAPASAAAAAAAASPPARRKADAATRARRRLSKRNCEKDCPEPEPTASRVPSCADLRNQIRSLTSGSLSSDSDLPCVLPGAAATAALPRRGAPNSHEGTPRLLSREACAMGVDSGSASDEPSRADNTQRLPASSGQLMELSEGQLADKTVMQLKVIVHGLGLRTSKMTKPQLLDAVLQVRRKLQSQGDDGVQAASEPPVGEAEEVVSEIPATQSQPAARKRPAATRQEIVSAIRLDRVLFEKVLTYEVLPIDWLASQLEAKGLKCRVADLKDTLTQLSVCFQEPKEFRKARTKKRRAAKQ